jgi:hypothetical protein
VAIGVAGGSGTAIWDTGNYTTSGSSTDYKGTPCKVTSRGTYDFAWELYDPDWFIDNCWYDDDPDISSIPMEPASEDIAQTPPDQPTFHSTPSSAKLYPVDSEPDPDTDSIAGPYTVVVDYTDPNGRGDLKNVYLQIKGDGTSQTIMYYDMTTPQQWTGEGDHLVNITANKATIANGYRVTFSFQLDGTWTPSKNVDFEAWAMDSAEQEGLDQTHEWNGVYDNALEIRGVRKVSLVDNDGDGYYSSLTIEADADTSVPSRAVKMILYRRDSGAGGSGTAIWDTGNYTTSGSSTDYKGTVCTVTNRGTYDFAWELYDPDWFIDNCWYDVDTGVSNIAMEPASDDPLPTHPAREFFDDFSYSGPDDPSLAVLGWEVRTASGGPGVTGAEWRKERVSFVVDGVRPVNALMRLSSRTRGSADTTEHAQVATPQRFLEGVYAARVRLSDATAYGPSSDGIVQAPLFTINSLKHDYDPDYSEIDFEYLPNDVWSGGTRPGPTMYCTTWETYRESPWDAVNDSEPLEMSFSGWHTLLFRVSGGHVEYFIDGMSKATHGGIYYPETPMSIMFQMWFVNGSLAASIDEREWQMDIDWVWHSNTPDYNTSQIEYLVADLRASGTVRRDTFNEPPTDIALSNSTVPENQPSGTAVGVFTTTDPEAGNTFTYTLVSGGGSTDNASFTVGNGTLRAAASFSYEVENSYSIRVRSSDQGGRWTEKAFNISIINVQVALPTCSPPSGTRIPDEGLDVAIGCVTDGAGIWYTMDGSDPVCGGEGSTLYDGNAIHLTESTTIKVVGCLAGLATSEPGSARFRASTLDVDGDGLFSAIDGLYIYRKIFVYDSNLVNPFATAVLTDIVQNPEGLPAGTTSQMVLDTINDLSSDLDVDGSGTVGAIDALYIYRKAFVYNSNRDNPFATEQLSDIVQDSSELPAGSIPQIVKDNIEVLEP